MLFLGSRISWESVIAALIAGAITLTLFLSNRAKSGSTVQGILMTVWQILVGFAVFLILAIFSSNSTKKKD